MTEKPPDGYFLVTEREFGSRDSLVLRTELRLRSYEDAQAIKSALHSGRLRTKPGVWAGVLPQRGEYNLSTTGRGAASKARNPATTGTAARRPSRPVFEKLAPRRVWAVRGRDQHQTPKAKGCQ